MLEIRQGTPHENHTRPFNTLFGFHRAASSRRVNRDRFGEYPADISRGMGKTETWVQQVPTDVHIQLSKRAVAEGMSLSELVASILDQAIDDRVKGLRHERHKTPR